MASTLRNSSAAARAPAPARPASRPAALAAAPAAALPRHRAQRRQRRALAAAAAGKGFAPGGGGDAPAAGVARQLAETAALDALIDELLAAADAQDLSRRVADNVTAFDQRFWLRVATRSDTAATPEQKEALATLARVVMQLVDAMMTRTEQQLDSSAAALQEILRAAADARGEWELPLAPEQADALRDAVHARADAGALDEALLSNCFAWMKKAGEDGLDGMVVLLQKVLQLYAARALASAAAPPGAAGGAAEAALAALLGADEGAWGGELRARAAGGELSEPALMEALQRRMEGVVLGLPSGSYAQRVQAEFLKELEARAKAVFADLAAGR
jgi:hypothetical protein